MSTTVRVAVFALALVLAAGAATALGAAVGPVEIQTAGHGDGHRDSHEEGHRDQAGPAKPTDTAVPGGLLVSQDGYTLQVLTDRIDQPGRTMLRFRVLDPWGAPVTAYEESHGKDLHLISVRRDLSDYRHVHPVRDAEGTWSVPLVLSTAGEYRLFADFRPAGAPSGYTLGHDLSVAGDYQPDPLPAPSTTARVDGYEVRLDGEAVAGDTSRLALTVTRDGAPVTDLQPYLGAYGHLVALRDHDLAYLHVHADDATVAGPVLTFDAEVPSSGDFRLFLDFRHGGQVRTASFTATASPTGASGDRPDDAPSAGSPGSEDSHADTAHH